MSDGDTAYQFSIPAEKFYSKKVSAKKTEILVFANIKITFSLIYHLA